MLLRQSREQPRGINADLSLRRIRLRRIKCRFSCIENKFFSFKGGVPATPSSTATLLRLHPSHSLCLRHPPHLRVRVMTLGIVSSHGVTGGVYKARERIHRRIADRRLLAIPPSCRRVAACNLN